MLCDEVTNTGKDSCPYSFTEWKAEDYGEPTVFIKCYIMEHILTKAGSSLTTQSAGLLLISHGQHLSFGVVPFKMLKITKSTCHLISNTATFFNSSEQKKCQLL